jgi:hypothetical protein
MQKLKEYNYSDWNNNDHPIKESFPMVNGDKIIIHLPEGSITLNVTSNDNTEVFSRLKSSHLDYPLLELNLNMITNDNYHSSWILYEKVGFFCCAIRSNNLYIFSIVIATSEHITNMIAIPIEANSTKNEKLTLIRRISNFLTLKMPTPQEALILFCILWGTSFYLDFRVSLLLIETHLMKINNINQEIIDKVHNNINAYNFFSNYFYFASIFFIIIHSYFYFKANGNQ